MSSVWSQQDNGNENPVLKVLLLKFLLESDTTLYLLKFYTKITVSNKATSGTPVQQKDNEK